MYRCNRSEITLDLTSGLPLRPTVDFVVEKMCLLGEPYSAISWRCNFSSCYSLFSDQETRWVGLSKDDGQ